MVLFSPQLVSRMLSIDHVMDTCVGDDMLKGISGGQKRRVTAGEPGTAAALSPRCPSPSHLFVQVAICQSAV